MAVREGVLFCLGNPLLDITARPDADFLVEYGLEPNNAILAEDKHFTMYERMLEKYPVDYSAGGSVQNAARVFQWFVNVKNAATYVGCIGKDKFGDILTGVSQDAGVNVKYMLHDSEPTGKCAVLVTGTHRSLCAYLAAANCMVKQHLETPVVEDLVNKAEFFYIEGYHLTVSPESILHLAEHASKHNKVFSINLNAPFLVTAFREPMMKVLPYMDVIMSNEMEAEAFSDEHQYGTKSLTEIALKMLELPKVNPDRKRLVIITHGSDPVIVAYDGKITEYSVPKLEESKIVDTNGAGDAFAGGFLAMYVQGKPIGTCIRCGIYAAAEVIQREGCTVPAKHTFSE